MRYQAIAGLLLGASIGLSIGIGTYTFVYAKGWSYMTDNPAACANCHVMNDHYTAWIKSSHHTVATCNDCHTPAGFVRKYYTKASNGFWHSYAFTTGNFREPIYIKPHNQDIVQEACRKCHMDIVEEIEGPHTTANTLSCLPCHASVGHLAAK
jgi:cytochrome c nitrite reductase small subunit